MEYLIIINIRISNVWRVSEKSAFNYSQCARGPNHIFSLTKIIIRWLIWNLTGPDLTHFSRLIAVYQQQTYLTLTGRKMFSYLLILILYNGILGHGFWHEFNEVWDRVIGTFIVVRKEQLEKIIFSYWNNLMTCRLSCENFSSKLCKNQPCLRREYLSQHLITKVVYNLMHFEAIRCNLDCTRPIAGNKYRSPYEERAISVLVFRSFFKICWEKADKFQKLCHNRLLCKTMHR